MKFNVYFTLRGAGGTIEVPNMFNPVEATDLEEALILLSSQLIVNESVGLTTVGVRVEEAE